MSKLRRFVGWISDAMLQIGTDIAELRNAVLHKVYVTGSVANYLIEDIHNNNTIVVQYKSAPTIDPSDVDYPDSFITAVKSDTDQSVDLILYKRGAYSYRVNAEEIEQPNIGARCTLKPYGTFVIVKVADSNRMLIDGDFEDIEPF